MKVGTDGVLLGAWCKANNPSRILDIGTGTGLIALMCAQRFPLANIYGIEPEPNAFNQALENSNDSTFSQQITILQSSLTDYSPTQSFDLIVCNPPFYIEDTQAPTAERSQARSASHLPLQEILLFAAAHLGDSGSLALVLPYARLAELEEQTMLNISNVTQVKGTAVAPIKRILVSLTKTPTKEVESSLLVIEEKRHEYTAAYRALTKDFYLKF